ncbi:hypothetical protein THAOC_34656, partial [Thalassiosira oceanica]
GVGRRADPDPPPGREEGRAEVPQGIEGQGGLRLRGAEDVRRGQGRAAVRDEGEVPAGRPREVRGGHRGGDRAERRGRAGLLEVNT